MPKVESHDKMQRKIVQLEKELERCRQVEQDLRLKELRLGAIFKQSFQFALILDHMGRVLEMNDLCRAVCGDLAKGVVGHPLSDAGWWKPFEEVRISTRQAIEKALLGEVVTDTAIFMDKTGSTRQGIRIFSPVRDKTGRIYMISVVGLDISDKKKVEKELLESQDKYHSLLNSFPGTAYQFVADADGSYRFEFIGEKCREIFGLSAVEILADGRKVFELLPAPDAELVSGAIEESLRTLEPYKVDHRVRKTNGETIWLHASSIPRKRSNGEVIWDGIAYDITERKRAEENLQIYKNVVSSTTDGISYLDRHYRYVIVNDAYERFSGIRRENFLGKTVAEYLGDEIFHEQIKPHLDQCLGGEIVRFRNWFDYPQLGRRLAEVTYFPYRNSHQDIVGVVAVTRDITEHEQAREALRQSYDDLTLRHRIANSLLTYSKDRVFNNLLDLLQETFTCKFGYIGYIDDHGDLVCPSMTFEIWSKCQIPAKSTVFPKERWGGIWGESLIGGRAVRRNRNLKTPEGHVPLDNAMVVPMLADGELVGQIAIANKPTDFTPEDQRQLESLADFMAPMLRVYIAKERAEQDLQAHARELEEKNIALKVLLENREEEKRKTAEATQAKFEQLVFPYIEKLKKQHRRDDIHTIVDIVEANTRQSLLSLDAAINSIYRQLTPTEIQVADLIKKGKTSKQIAAVLNASPRSIFFHRNNIRKKLNLHNSKINLRTFLLSQA